MSQLLYLCHGYYFYCVTVIMTRLILLLLLCHGYSCYYCVTLRKTMLTTVVGVFNFRNTVCAFLAAFGRWSVSLPGHRYPNHRTMLQGRSQNGSPELQNGSRELQNCSLSSKMAPRGSKIPRQVGGSLVGRSRVSGSPAGR